MKYKISQIIQTLEDRKRKMGDLPVYVKWEKDEMCHADIDIFASVVRDVRIDDNTDTDTGVEMAMIIGFAARMTKEVE